MSVRAMAAVWAGSAQSGSALLMLLAIADFSDDDGRAYPAVGTLANKCRMKPRNAIYLLRQIAESGELDIKPATGPRGVNSYRIRLDRLQPLQPGAPLQDSAPLQPNVGTPAMGCTSPLQPIAPKPSMNHKNHKGTGLRKLKPVPVWVSKDQMVTDGLQAETASEFIAHRQDLKRPLTVRAWSDLVREAAKARWSVEDAVAKVLAKGWISFEARFVEGAARSDGDASARPWEGAR